MSKKIMIIDDDPAIVKYLESLFKNNGYTTCFANDGSGAIDIARQESPDLITLDLEMPEEWGPKFYRQMARENMLKNTPVIVISGLAGNKYAIHKAVASLTKPFDQDELLGIVGEVLGE